MSWKLFNRGGDDSPPRRLSHPKELKTADIFKLGFTEHEQLSTETFKVVGIRTYDLGGETRKKPTFIIENENGLYQLSVINDNGVDKLEFGLPVIPEDINEIFTFDQFGQIFNPDLGVNQKLERHAEPERFSGWTAPLYMQEAGLSAYVYQQDYRNSPMPEEADAGEGIDYLHFVSDDRKHALQVEVYDGGKTDVYLQVMLAVDKMEEMWPSE